MTTSFFMLPVYEKTLKLDPDNAVLYLVSGAPAGPPVTEPVVENVDPCAPQ